MTTRKKVLMIAFLAVTLIIRAPSSSKYQPIENVQVGCEDTEQKVVKKDEALILSKKRPEADRVRYILEEAISEMEVPDVSTAVKYFTDYRFFGLTGTPHYRLQQECVSDNQGFRRFNSDYCVALGSYYSTKIGDRFRVTLSTGRTFTIIVADAKWDSDCDQKNMYMPCTNANGESDGNLLEFIIDKKTMNSTTYSKGDISHYYNFKGSVVKMEYLGRDDSQDWDHWDYNWEDS